MKTYVAPLLEQFEAVANMCKPVSRKSLSTKQKWGPVVASRVSSRNKKDGRPALQKAQELKQIKNLEVPIMRKGTQNSFACLDDSLLIKTADFLGIDLGPSSDSIRDNISIIKQIELDRLDKFNLENPDVFLPPSTDITGEEFNNSVPNPRCNTESEEVTHMNVDPEPDSPWIKVKISKSCIGRRKIDFVIK